MDITLLQLYASLMKLRMWRLLPISEYSYTGVVYPILEFHFKLEKLVHYSQECNPMIYELDATEYHKPSTRAARGRLGSAAPSQAENSLYFGKNWLLASTCGGKCRVLRCAQPPNENFPYAYIINVTYDQQ